MYKKTTNKDRVLSQIDFVIGEMKFAIETTKDVPDESYFGTTSAGMILFRSSCMCIQNVSEGFRQIDSHTCRWRTVATIQRCSMEVNQGN